MSHTKFGLIGSAVLTFIGYKQTDKQNLYIDITLRSYIYIYICVRPNWLNTFEGTNGILKFHRQRRALPLGIYNSNLI